MKSHHNNQKLLTDFYTAGNATECWPWRGMINVLRGDGPTARKARQVLCDNGHPIMERDPRGYRFCRICLNARARKNRARRKLLKLSKELSHAE